MDNSKPDCASPSTDHTYGQTDSQNNRPQDLSFPKKKLIEGRHFFDLSEESGEQNCLAVDKTVEANSNEEENHMVAFVAEDFQEKIRSSSSDNSCPSAGSHSTSSNVSSSFLPDPQILNDLEAQAKQISVQLDRILLEFSGSLHGMTTLTVDCVGCYTNSVKKTCDSVDGTIKSMYQMLAKSEELLHVLKSLPGLAKQIREIKRLLDLFESHMQKSHG